MKTQVNIQELYENIKRELQERHKKILIDAGIDGTKDGRINQPEAIAKDCEPYYSKLRNLYKQLYHDLVNGALKGTQQLLIGSMEIKTINEKIDAKKQQINEVTHEQQNMKDEMTRLNIQHDPSRHMVTMWFFFLLLTLADATSMTFSFVYFVGDYLIPAIAVGIIAALGVMVLLKISVVAYRDSTNKSYKKLLLFLVVPIVVFVGIFFGILRSMQVKHDGGNGNFLVMLIFIVLNFVILVVSVLYFYEKSPSKQQNEEYSRWRKLKKDIQLSEAVITQLQQQKDALDQEKTFIGLYRFDLRTINRNLVELIETYFQEAVACYIDRNVHNRTDHAYPPGFRISPKPLDLPIDDEKIAPVLKESHEN